MALSAPALEQEILRLPWRAVLAEPLVVLSTIERRPTHSAVAAVPFLGVWSGWLTVRCDLRLMHEIASRMRGEDLVRGCDLDDATRWLALVLAQGLQPSIDPQARLGPATVLEPNEPWTPRWCQPAARLLFTSGDRILGVALDERMPVTLRSTGMFESDLDDAPTRERETDEVPLSPATPISKRRVF
jgi:hypothetical protein